jgi:hypothetical protein
LQQVLSSLPVLVEGGASDDPVINALPCALLHNGL